LSQEQQILFEKPDIVPIPIPSHINKSVLKAHSRRKRLWI